MSIVKEFREFAVKGNMMDMAVGIIIGGAFGKCVSSLVGDMILPPLGLIMGKMDFSQYTVMLKAGETLADGKVIPPIELRFGPFLNTVIDFVIVAFAVFMLVKAINRLRRAQEAAPVAPPEPPAEQRLLTEIRDILKAGR